MKNNLTALATLITVFTSSAQNLPILTAKIGETVYVPSVQDKRDKIECEELFRKVYETKELQESDLTEQQKNLLARADDLDDVMKIGGNGCSWYCAGGPHKITASSALTSNKHLSYSANNAHDFDANTAWIEGKEDYGIGEYIEYFFLANSPPVTTVKIINGYIKNKNAWKENSRVKKLKLYINNKPSAILDLKDTVAFQEFKLSSPLQSKIQGSDLVLKFEIMEVYPGDKYKDVAITEIEFDGTGVHCFRAGTKIVQPNGETKNIENIKIGDKILSFNQQTKQTEEAIVLETAFSQHHNLYELDFEGYKISVTDDHPFFYKGIFYSLKPNNTYGQTTKQLSVGDKIEVSKDGQMKAIELTSIHKLEICEMTYTITKLDRNKLFFANGLCVATEEITATIALTDK